MDPSFIFFQWSHLTYLQHNMKIRKINESTKCVQSVFVVLWHFITRVGSRNDHHNQDRTTPSPQRPLSIATLL